MISFDLKHTAKETHTHILSKADGQKESKIDGIMQVNEYNSLFITNMN